MMLMMDAARAWVADVRGTRLSVLLAAVAVGGLVTLGSVVAGGAWVVWWAVGG